MSSKHDRSFILSAVLRFRKPLVAYSASLLKDIDRARDVVQEIFLKLCDEELDVDRERIEPWLFKVCRNLSIDTLRSGRRLTAIEAAPERSEASPAVELLELRQEVAGILELIETLPPNQQEVLQLKFMHDLSYKEISEVTELSVGNVGYLIHVGLKTLRERVQAKERARLVRSEMNR